MPLNILIKYYSISGNTKAVANIISENIRNKGHNVLVSNINEKESPEAFDLIFIGSFTINNGKLPVKTKNYLKWLIKDNNFNIPKFSVFGTGDTQWAYFCRAVDEMEYHLNKVTDVIGKLKIEQHPVNQQQKIIKYINEVMEAIQFEKN
ncbi:flavodoxin domain-containing protein [Heyndrickxia camelliae]|uniref:flavodoxin domain-containing protein n=1 Tax=Heyndrickxia camelliae TaxID=1707093 RepID=UPI0013FD36BC|nr:flavodoxin domain-containing protein [Heyndrickxia camelliae]